MPETLRGFMANFDLKDPFEKWQFLIFRTLLFILFLAGVWKLLAYELGLR